MKNYILTLFLLGSVTLFSQIAPPQAFSYSAVARNGTGNPLVNQTIGLQFSILSGSTTGPIVYQENQFTTTNSLGLFTLMLGQGQVQQGGFSTIAWGHNAFYLKVGLDATGGTNFQIMGISQFLSVPYAMYADSAGHSNATYQILSTSNDTLYLSNGGSVYLGKYKDSLLLSNDTLSLSHGNKVVLPTSNVIANFNGVPITDPSLNFAMVSNTTFITKNNYRFDIFYDQSLNILTNERGPQSDSVELFNNFICVTTSSVCSPPYYAYNYSNGVVIMSPGRVFEINGNVYYIPFNATPVTLSTVNRYSSIGGCGTLYTGTPSTFLPILPNDPAVTGFPFNYPTFKLTFTRQ